MGYLTEGNVAFLAGAHSLEDTLDFPLSKGGALRHWVHEPLVGLSFADV